MGEARADLAADYQALRHGRGAFRLPRDVVAVSGPDAPAYLQGQCSQDVVALAPGQSADALLLAPDGKLVALMRVTRLGPDAFVLDTDAGFGEAVVARLARFKLRSKVELVPLDWSCVALRGDGWGPRRPGGGAEGGHSLAVDWAGWRGVDLLGPESSGPCPPTPLEQCRGLDGLPDRVRGAGHGGRARREDHRRRGRPGRAVGQLHQGLLHRPGAGGPAGRPGQQGGPSPAGRGRRSRCRGRPACSGPRCGLRGSSARSASAPRPPSARPWARRWPWPTCTVRSPRRPRSSSRWPRRARFRPRCALSRSSSRRPRPRRAWARCG